MQIYYRGWEVVQKFIEADAYLPRPGAALPQPAEREVARRLEARREYPVVEVIAALRALAQPELLTTESGPVAVATNGVPVTGSVLSPIPRRT